MPIYSAIHPDAR